jgi:hypothetical protein
LAFALGSLQATVDAQKEEMSRQRETLIALPAKVAEAITPRIIVLEEKVTHLERDKNFVRGGLVIFLVGLSYIIGKPYIPHI